MVTLYGIPNCDTVKKTRRWLEAHAVEYVFHDYKKAGVSPKLLAAWCSELGVDALLNRRGTTWRNLPIIHKENVTQQRAIELMVEHPSLIKRPLLDIGTKRIVGFDEKELVQLFK